MFVQITKFWKIMRADSLPPYKVNVILLERTNQRNRT